MKSKTQNGNQPVCKQCRQARVVGPWSELCQSCIDAVARERRVFVADYEPDDEGEMGGGVGGEATIGPRPTFRRWPS